MNDPKVLIPTAYVNVISFTTDATANVPLYAEFPIPVGLVLSVTFLTIILSPTWRLCASSEITVTILDGESKEQVEINLGFLL